MNCSYDLPRISPNVPAAEKSDGLLVVRRPRLAHRARPGPAGPRQRQARKEAGPRTKINIDAKAANRARPM